MHRFVLFAALGAAGCHWVLPLSSGGPDSSVTVVDRSVVNDGVSGDRAKHDLPHDTAFVADGAAWDTGPCPSPAGCGCVDSEGQGLTVCSGPKPADDADGDGLPDSRDPWPSQPNPMLVADGFGTDPVMRWDFNGVGGWDSLAATYALNASASAGLSQTCAACLPDPDYLVEVRVTVAAIHDPIAWSVRLFAAKDGSQQVRCMLTQSSYTATPTAMVHIWDQSSLTEWTGQYDPAPAKIDLSVEKTFILQTWGYKDAKGDHQHVCRVLDASGVVVRASATVAWPISTPGIVRLAAVNVDLTLDHVRAFGH